MRLVYRLLFAIVYLLGCCYFALATLGGGHGTLVFVVPLITIIAFVVAIVVVGPTSKSFIRRIAVCLVIFHYLFTFISVYIVESGDGFVHTLDVLTNFPLAILVPSIWYGCGQYFFWFLILRTAPIQS